LRDHRAASELTRREVAVLDYAVATAIGQPTAADVARLREEGFDDASIVDVAVTAALRLFGSRVYDALGVETDPFFLEQQDLIEILEGAVR
jgi:alkylhydroperoxidase family enzyme